MSNPYWTEITQALDLPATPFAETGRGALPSVFAVSDFASATVGAAGAALAALSGGDASDVVVDRRRASLWFDMTVAPLDWELPSIWDPIAGVYQTRDGFVRLHTNAPHHRDAALSVLGCENDRQAVTTAVKDWTSEALESAVVEAKGCAAAARSRDAWQAHPQGLAVRAAPLITWHEDATVAAAHLPTRPSRPLAGVRVLDLTRVLAGPVASRFLAGYGAEVLRIDPPHWNEPAAELEVTLGKRCAGLNLHDGADRTTFESLLRRADIFLHGYRPGALENLGYGPEARRALNPTVVDVSLSAYGRTGPWSHRRGFDSLVQMSCGIADEGGRASGRDAPLPLPVQALDHGTGYLMAAAVLRALDDRQRGQIRRAELSLARTAETLVSAPGSLSPEIGIERRSDDLADHVEQTSWGPAHRVRPPLSVQGQEPVWALPAGKVRRHSARWTK